MKDIIICIAFSVLLVMPSLGQVNIENRKSLSNNSENGYYILDHLARIHQAEVPAVQKIDQLIKEDSLVMGTKTIDFSISKDEFM